MCTVQLTIFSDGSTLPPLIIFRGNGLRIKLAEKQQWNQRVKVVFQPKGWCHATVMKNWVKKDWGNIFLNPATPGSNGIPERYYLPTYTLLNKQTTLRFCFEK